MNVYRDGDDGIWSDGYFMSTVGVNEEIISNYIENQGKEDSGQAQLELGNAVGGSPNPYPHLANLI